MVLDLHRGDKESAACYYCAVMPPKNSRSKKVSQTSTVKATNAQTCCICCVQVQPSKDKALFCSGTCQQWLHRYCASVSANQYKTIKSSDSPFYCYCCYQTQKEEQLSALVRSVEAMKQEILELRVSISTEAISSKANRLVKFLI